MPTEVTLHLTFRRRHTLQAVGALARLSTRETGRDTGGSDSRGRADSIIQIVIGLQYLCMVMKLLGCSSRNT